MVKANLNVFLTWNGFGPHFACLEALAEAQPAAKAVPVKSAHLKIAANVIGAFLTERTLRVSHQNKKARASALAFVSHTSVRAYSPNTILAMMLRWISFDPP